MLVSEVMNRTVVTVRADAPVSDAVFLFRKHGFRHLPVLEGRRLVGIVSDRDVLRWLSPRIGTDDEREGDYEPLHFPLEDVMTRAALTAREAEPLAEVIDRMLAAHVSAVPVVDEDGNLLGIVSMVDLARLLRSRLTTGV